MKPVYQFDLEGNLICMFDSANDASKKLKLDYFGLKNAIYRCSCIQGRFYLGHEAKLEIKTKKYNHNPLNMSLLKRAIPKEVVELDRDIRSGRFNFRDLFDVVPIEAII